MAKTYEAEVKGLGIIHRVEEPFDEALKTIKGAGAVPITARDLAYARMREGDDSSLCTRGSYIKEGVVYIPSKALLIRNSPLLNQKLAQEAVQVHRKSNEFHVNDKLTKKYQEQAEADKNKFPEKKRILIISKRGTFEIPTNRFKDEELTLWLFEDLAEDYGDFLKNNKINRMPVYLTSNNKEKFANQLWLGNLGLRSYLNGDYRLLGFGHNVRGVLKESAAGTSQKFSEKLPYTPKQVDKISKIINGVRQGNIPASKLEKALEFLNRLKE